MMCPGTWSWWCLPPGRIIQVKQEEQALLYSSLVQSPKSIGEMVMLLTKWVTAEKVRDVIGNNPTIFEYDLEEIEEKIRFLTYTMNVSSYRVAMTPKSLTHDLDFFTLRRDNINMTR